MSDALLQALIGLVGSLSAALIGAFVTLHIHNRQSDQSTRPAESHPAAVPGPRRRVNLAIPFTAVSLILAVLFGVFLAQTLRTPAAPPATALPATATPPAVAVAGSSPTVPTVPATAPGPPATTTPPPTAAAEPATQAATATLDGTRALESASPSSQPRLPSPTAGPSAPATGTPSPPPAAPSETPVPPASPTPPAPAATPTLAPGVYGTGTHAVLTPGVYLVISQMQVRTATSPGRAPSTTRATVPLPSR